MDSVSVYYPMQHCRDAAVGADLRAPAEDEDARSVRVHRRHGLPLVVCKYLEALHVRREDERGRAEVAVLLAAVKWSALD